MPNGKKIVFRVRYTNPDNDPLTFTMSDTTTDGKNRGFLSVADIINSTEPNHTRHMIEANYADWTYSLYQLFNLMTTDQRFGWRVPKTWIHGESDTGGFMPHATTAKQKRDIQQAHA